MVFCSINTYIYIYIYIYIYTHMYLYVCVRVYLSNIVYLIQFLTENYAKHIYDKKAIHAYIHKIENKIFKVAQYD